VAIDKEILWVFKAVDSIEVLRKCIKRSVQIAKKNAKFPLSREKIVLFIAGTVFQSIRSRF